MSGSGLALGLVVLGGLTLLRAVTAAGMDLMPQDAYYFLYAESPALSYHDHPPLIGYLLWLGKVLFGKSELAVRAVTLTTALLLQLGVGWLALRLFDRESGGRALALFAALPMCTVLSLVSSPDLPLLLAWTVALLGLESALFRGSRRGWLVAGLGMGLAFLSKYTALFLPAGLVLFLLLSSRHRHRLRSPGPWIALGISQLLALPVYLWNLRHGGASVGFQLQERLGALAGFDLDDLLGYLLTQGLSLLPVPLALMIGWALRGSWLPRLRALDGRRLFLWCFFAPLFLTALALSPFLWVKLNWPMAAVVAGILLLTPKLSEGRALRIHLASSGAIHLLILVQVFLYPVPVESDDTWFGWSEIAERVEARHREDPSRFVFSTDSYKTTAELRFYSDLPEVRGYDVIDCPALHLEYVSGDPGELEGRDALLVISEDELRPSRRSEAVLERVDLFFQEVRELPPIVLEHRGRRARFVRLFAAEGYRGPDAAGAADRKATGDPCRFSPTS
ncbi:MAG: glycosyltransferase family 39 protein [Thermoanaerobaculia bacterium]|nr:glycosyltransferase family 39 protein [Thermoanaerobaculia bacterium]